ncbi:hypothetical protein Pcinc_027695 [Petrolisthes cinctipes]|uniref:Uncharacterized protein n=1 Tax=Petrolisthes cinctipes TaxID=88211 RepID=A0AAE1K8E0_PETCI|nr:hypothetical protein Pcinc_027695 [Petrolisthes cinctipes]
MLRERDAPSEEVADGCEAIMCSLFYSKGTKTKPESGPRDLVEKPNIPDPLILGWKKEGDKLIPELSSEAAAPDCVLELVKWQQSSYTYEMYQTVQLQETQP